MTGDIIPFSKPNKHVADMTADEILAYFKGKYQRELIVIAYDSDGRVEVSSNTTYERAHWMLGVAQGMMLDGA